MIHDSRTRVTESVHFTVSLRDQLRSRVEFPLCRDEKSFLQIESRSIMHRNIEEDCRSKKTVIEKRETFFKFRISFLGKNVKVVRVVIFQKRKSKNLSIISAEVMDLMDFLIFQTCVIKSLLQMIQQFNYDSKLSTSA